MSIGSIRSESETEFELLDRNRGSDGETERDGEGGRGDEVSERVWKKEDESFLLLLLPFIFKIGRAHV